MCGIIGYVGRDSALPILIDGLRRLEYRGYDSAGVAVLNGGSAIVRKCAGRIDALAAAVEDLDSMACVGIGHTRWATHGPPTDGNAHPHCDCEGNVALVHNGIIENYVQLRSWLQDRGHRFQSETDTEVIPHLVEEFMREGCDLETAMRRAAGKLQGAFAMVAVSGDDPGRLVAVRKASPLVIGLGEGENLIASDIPAILRRTRDMIILEDGDVGVLTTAGVTVTAINGESVERVIRRVEWDPEQAERGGFPHFMLKEIHEQPDAVAATLRGRLDPQTGRIDVTELLGRELELPGRIHIVACGTAYHAGLVGRDLIERMARIPVTVSLASEFRYGDPIVGESDLVIAISQSGETADTLASIEEARGKGARVLAITNVVGSSVSRVADDVLYTRAGPEVAVAATKTYTCQLVALMMLGLYLGERSGRIDRDQAGRLGLELAAMPGLLADTLAPWRALAVEELADELTVVEDCFFLGRGLDYAVAQEGQLKMKEISYVHAEALAAGELKHGTLALIMPGVHVIAAVTQPELFDKVANNLAQVKSRGGRTVVAVTDDNPGFDDSDVVLRIPPVRSVFAPVLAVVPMQLLAYYAGVKRGCDVDKPRNLAKSVTVE